MTNAFLQIEDAIRPEGGDDDAAMHGIVNQDTRLDHYGQDLRTPEYQPGHLQVGALD